MHQLLERPISVRSLPKERGRKPDQNGVVQMLYIILKKCTENYWYQITAKAGRLRWQDSSWSSGLKASGNALLPMFCSLYLQLEVDPARSFPGDRGGGHVWLFWLSLQAPSNRSLCRWWWSNQMWCSHCRQRLTRVLLSTGDIWAWIKHAAPWREGDHFLECGVIEFASST